MFSSAVVRIYDLGALIMLTKKALFIKTFKRWLIL